MRSSSQIFKEPHAVKRTKKREREDVVDSVNVNVNQHFSILPDAADEIQTPPKVNRCSREGSRFSPIKYNGKPFSGSKIIGNSIFNKSKQKCLDQAFQDARDSKLAAMYGLTLEEYRKKNKSLEQYISRLSK